jgi:hypothetical protein
MKAPRPIDLPPAVAKAFVRGLREYFAAEDQRRADMIAARQLRGLAAIPAAARKGLRLRDIKQMFWQMKDEYL